MPPESVAASAGTLLQRLLRLAERSAVEAGEFVVKIKAVFDGNKQVYGCARRPKVGSGR